MIEGSIVLACLGRDRMKGGDIIVETLRNIDSKITFGLPRIHTLDIYRALCNEGSIRHILMKHEASAGVPPMFIVG